MTERLPDTFQAKPATLVGTGFVGRRVSRRSEAFMINFNTGIVFPPWFYGRGHEQRVGSKNNKILS